ncbi:hypothetical protein [Thioalkalivibrio sp. XN8]|uniref:hypothetical protein n=1 Tax=Thioalkalivibrio sp. XN8 TaxID=2712863 RepID=UPI0013EA1878|nr:hypothetical protein [Thioalkalivibrio sp. XN8]NGP53589.1 hypothetical protein [Thioalkalivibrio sp. XN8]
MFKKLKEFFGEPSEEERLGQICALVLAQDQFSELRKSEAIVKTITDRVGTSVATILESKEESSRAYAARLELLKAAKRMAMAKRFPYLPERERIELAARHWPDHALSPEEALSAANTNYCVAFGETVCLDMILGQIDTTGERNWWAEYLILCMADPDAPVVDSAEQAILNGNGMEEFSSELAEAQAAVKALATNADNRQE